MCHTHKPPLSRGQASAIRFRVVQFPRHVFMSLSVPEALLFANAISTRPQHDALLRGQDLGGDFLAMHYRRDLQGKVQLFLRLYPILQQSQYLFVSHFAVNVFPAASPVV